jgi:hypothetical protein
MVYAPSGVEGNEAMMANWRTWSGRFGLFLLAAASIVAMLTTANAQRTFNEREVKSEASTLDKVGVWSFDFRFKDPRLIKVHVPGRGTRIYWYLWYQVINHTSKPERFVPEFELVALDYPAVFHDEVSPTVQEAIKRVEDPTGYQDIKNSVTISSEPIPVSKEDAFPRAVTGVAIWDGTAADPAKRDPKVKDLADATRYSIFVRGLSNGYVIVDPLVAGEPPITRYKTLQLNFKRVGDRTNLDSRDISFVPPAEWIYRAGEQKPPVKGADKAPGK